MDDELDAIPQLPGESDASVVARRLASALGETSDCDLEVPIQMFGETFIILLGPHAPSGEGWCWCQPKLEWCPRGKSHKHVIHEDRIN